MIVNNEAINYSIILNRNLQVKIDTNTNLKIEVEIFVFQDDDGNFRLDVNCSETNCIVHNGKKITGTNIPKFIGDYDKQHNTKMSKIITDYVTDYFKKYKNQEIKNLVKEHITIE